ncbi:spore germination protein [Ectobacillus antri]|uniref:Spore germination protein n=1 Tax=Ectobacillus antri TaxID=2486280 RepID=A0ABT6H0W9_9BACI|nr:spore germination protein [Ectobacillus antri]MDG4656355.1 spore germination protein [Ectobacillus antri]MDG5753030.1 spore germination protein [Ectobacillus antri]
MFFRKRRKKQKSLQKHNQVEMFEVKPTQDYVIDHGKTERAKQSIDTNSNEAQVEIDNGELSKQIKKAMNESPDLQIRSLYKESRLITIFFMKGAINEQALHEDVLAIIMKLSAQHITNEELKSNIPISRIQVSHQVTEICSNLMDGWIFIHIQDEQDGLLFNLSQPQYRPLFQSMNEANVLGPKLEFTESLETNAQVLRQLIKDEDLVMESYTLGRRAPKEVRITYMKGIADEENVKTFRERIQSIDVDDILDSSVLIQLIEENVYSLFPQFIMTEQPQRFAYSVLGGRIGVLVNGSPMAVLGPVTFFSFFESTEDLYFRWNVSTFFRLLRFVAVFISMAFTPVYVAALTYHYEVIPSALLVSLGQSRANVPFPPVMEALILEGAIELLREAGARLPTKVGQTIGIVGGIVIGQAAVQAGLTSNILIIAVALSALASFTSPNYVMGTVIRVIRFPLIILAGIAGGVGLTFGLTFLLIHLLKVTSLNRPYLAPIYPWRFRDLTKSIIRIPHLYSTERSSYNNPQDKVKLKENRKKQKKDIDE